MNSNINCHVLNNPIITKSQVDSLVSELRDQETEGVLSGDQSFYQKRQGPELNTDNY